MTNAHSPHSGPNEEPDGSQEQASEYIKAKLLDRAKRAQKIIECPAKYKICEGCESIVAAKVNVCPNCHSYRFEEDQQLIIAHARALGSRLQGSPDIDLAS